MLKNFEICQRETQQYNCEIHMHVGKKTIKDEHTTLHTLHVHEDVLKIKRGKQFPTYPSKVCQCFWIHTTHLSNQ